MKRKFLLLFFIFKFFCFCEIKIVVTTTILESLFNDIGKEKIDVKSLVPPRICPGHFDIRVSDLVDIYRTGIIFCHGYEKFIEKIKQQNQNIKIVKIKTNGSFLIPSICIMAGEEIKNYLIEIDKDGEKFYERNYKIFKERMLKVDEEIKKYKEKFKKIPVICSIRQKEFVEYLGLKIVSVIPVEEEMTIRKMKNIIDEGKRNKVKIVIENLQSYGDTGKKIAQEIGAEYIVFSNFPEKVSDYGIEDLIRENLKKLLRVLKNGSNRN